MDDVIDQPFNNCTFDLQWGIQGVWGGGCNRFLSECLKNKAQIAGESVKTNLELPGPLSGPWTPAESEFGSALVMCVLAHNLPPPPQ